PSHGCPSIAFLSVFSSRSRRVSHQWSAVAGPWLHFGYTWRVQPAVKCSSFDGQIERGLESLSREGSNPLSSTRSRFLMYPRSAPREREHESRHLKRLPEFKNRREPGAGLSSFPTVLRSNLKTPQCAGHDRPTRPRRSQLIGS